MDFSVEIQNILGHAKNGQDVLNSVNKLFQKEQSKPDIYVTTATNKQTKQDSLCVNLKFKGSPNIVIKPR